jgi:stage V sporulation protein D (sporulation-specific penicillin-binding protein)
MSQNGGRIILYTESDTPSATAIVPDVTGLTAEQANKKLTDAGLNVKISGTTMGEGTVVYSQSLPMGTVTPKGTVIEIELRYMAMG